MDLLGAGRPSTPNNQAGLLAAAGVDLEAMVVEDALGTVAAERTDFCSSLDSDQRST